MRRLALPPRRAARTSDLNDLIAPTPNVVLAAATGVNDAGDIVGTAAALVSAYPARLLRGTGMLPVFVQKV